MADKHPGYWRFVALLGRLDTVLQRTQAARAQLFADHGLDPSKDYDLSDDGETITERPTHGG